MNTRPTPETDEAQFGTGQVSVDFARRLESERDEARFDLDFRRRLGDWQNKTINELTHARDEARKQRDRLAEALQKVSTSWNFVEVAREALQSITPNEKVSDGGSLTHDKH